MFKTLANAWKIVDLRKKILFTLLIIVIYRIGAAIPVPFVGDFTMSTTGTTFEFLNTLSGGAFEQASLFALGVSPYITASIVIQLLSVAIPPLERLAKQGEEGKKKITQITRYVTIAISLITGLGYYFLLKYNGAFEDPFFGVSTFITVENEAGQKVLDILLAVVIVACYCAGSSIVMWLAEKINDKGIGNGISIILFANIVSRALPLFTKFVNMFQTEMGILSAKGLGQYVDGSGNLISTPSSTLEPNPFPVGSIIFTVFVLVGLLAMMWFIIFISDSERKIPVQYAKRVVGRKMYGGQNSNIPLKLNMAGVMPVIFANAIITIPAMISQFVPVVKDDGTVRVVWYNIVRIFSSTHWVYCILTFAMILAFAYFYVAISFNPTEVAGNIQKNGGAIPGIRPGKATSSFIKKVLSRVTFIGALALSVIAVVPLIINVVLEWIRYAKVDEIVGNVNVAFWSFTYLSELATIGTSIIIVVGVVLEVVREMEAQMTMRHYKGFLG